MKDFIYYAPRTVAEAIELLHRHEGKARLLAGGTDLLVRMKRRQLQPEALINLKTIPGLDFLSWEGDFLRLGPLVTLYQIESSPQVRSRFPVLSDTAAKMASAQVRNRATVAGNLANAAPSADMAPPLICLDALLELQSASGLRLLPLEQFFAGPGLTVLGPAELISAIRIPLAPTGSRVAYLKHEIRQAMDIAVVGVAVRLDLDEKGVCHDARVVLGAVAPTPLRSTAAEEILTGNRINEEVIEKAATLAQESARPISDVRSSASYRRHMVKVLVDRAIRSLVFKPEGQVSGV